jgi:putative membrane protein
MDRRVVITGLAAAVLAGPALAQTTAPTAQPGAAGTAAGGSMTNRTAGQMSQADMQHMQQTMQLGMVALESSRIALQKAQNADLKRFAQFEVQEQTILSEILRSMMDPSATAATSGTMAGQAASTPSAASGAAGGAMQMPSSATEMMQKLQSAQAGAEFDRQYLQAQMQGHRDLLQVQETYLSSNPQNREHMNVAKMARTQIREHIALLEDMQQTIR